MARRKKGTDPAGFEPVGDHKETIESYGSFTIPSYPYGSKKPPEPQEKPVERETITLNGIPIDFIPPWPTQTEATETESKGTEPSMETEAATDPDATLPEPDAKPGDTLPASTAAVAADADTSRAPPSYPGSSIIGRLSREGRWKEISKVRDNMMLEAKAAGMKLDAARAWCYAELDRLYPPIAPPPDPKPVPAPEITTSAPESTDLPGLYSIPPDWPPLPDNAALQAELGWVQSQRLAVVEERGNATIVRLERASSPAPSKAAIGWLETSIRSYAKYIEVAAKTLAGQADEAESVRRERMRLDDIRALLDEMHRDQV